MPLLLFNKRGVHMSYRLDVNPCPVFVQDGMPNVTSDFGVRVHPITHKVTVHNGIDITRWIGWSDIADICAIQRGKVIKIINSVKGYSEDIVSGNSVWLEHSSGYVTKYHHLAYLTIPKSLKVGDIVEERQFIGTMGSTGRSTGAHLHFQVELNGKPIDPKPFLLKKFTITPYNNDKVAFDMYVHCSPCKKGDKGITVHNLQVKLSQQSAEFEKEMKSHSWDKSKNDFDSSFGKGLKATLTKFQEIAGIEANGECDDATCNVLNASLCTLEGKIQTALSILSE